MKHFILTTILVCLLVNTQGGKARGEWVALNTEDIQTVEYCDLVKNPSLYDGKKIRLRGVYRVSGKYDSAFSSSACASGNTLWVDFEQSYQSCSPPKLVKSLNTMLRKSGMRWGRPHVTVVVIEYRSAEVMFVGNFKAGNPYKRPKPVDNPEFPFRHVPPRRETYDYVFSVSCVEKVRPLPENAKY